MTIGGFVGLFYIKAYLKNQDRAFKNLVEGSVENRDILTYDLDSYHGFIHGNGIQAFAKKAIEAGLSTEKIAQYIETLYATKHNGTRQSKEKYEKKTYKEALYDQVKDRIDGITPDNMSTELAKIFYNLIQAAKAESVIKDIRMADIVSVMKLRKEISKILSEMITIGRYIADPSDADVADDGFKNVSIPNLFKRLSEYQSKLHEKASSLHACNAPHLEEAINKVFISTQGITESDFILTKYEFMIESSRSYRLHYLLDALTKLQDEAEKQSKSQ